MAAQQVGISGRTLEKAVKAVEKRPELEEKLRRGEISVEEAYRLAKGQGQEKPREKEPTEKGGRVPTVGPQVVVTLPPRSFALLEELAGHFGLRLRELASRGLMEWIAAQAQGSRQNEPQICLRLPLRDYRALEELSGPSKELAELCRGVLIFVARHPKKYRELWAPVRVAEGG